MKKLSLLFLCSMLAAAPALAVNASYYVAVSESAPLNIRESASTESGIITTAERGETLTTTGKTDGLWLEVFTDSYTYVYREGQEAEEIGPLNGWVQITYLGEEPYNEVSGTVAGPGKVCLRSELRIADDTALAWVPEGTSVDVLSVFEYDGERWYRVQHGKERGFMVADYMEVEI